MGDLVLKNRLVDPGFSAEECCDCWQPRAYRLSAYGFTHACRKGTLEKGTPKPPGSPIWHTYCLIPVYTKPDSASPIQPIPLTIKGVCREEY